jgi:hypothetical protein
MQSGVLETFAAPFAVFVDRRYTQIPESVFLSALVASNNAMEWHEPVAKSGV